MLASELCCLALFVDSGVPIFFFLVCILAKDCYTEKTACSSNSSHSPVCITTGSLWHGHPNAETQEKQVHI